jgi:hypothetical protein
VALSITLIGALSSVAWATAAWRNIGDFKHRIQVREPEQLAHGRRYVHELQQRACLAYEEAICGTRTPSNHRALVVPGNSQAIIIAGMIPLATATMALILFVRRPRETDSARAPASASTSRIDKKHFQTRTPIQE